jgi:hypothetical protein
MSATLDRTKQKPRPERLGPDPTGDQFGAYGQAFDHFNRELFSAALPRCILNFSRHARCRGFFAAERWSREGRHTHEISLNPDVLNRPLKDSMGTLVHEMVHLWQQESGEPSRRGYHNAEWADKMESLGLMPSHTGEPGGKRIGQNVTHYIIAGGPFDRAFHAMPAEYQLPWTSGSPAAAAEPRRDKVKYQCPSCAVNVWGKAELNIVCGDCGERFQSAG